LITGFVNVFHKNRMLQPKQIRFRSILNHRYIKEISILQLDIAKPALYISRWTLHEQIGKILRNTEENHLPPLYQAEIISCFENLLLFFLS